MKIKTLIFRYLLLSAALVWTIVPASAQEGLKELSAEQAAVAAEEINRAAAEAKSISCNFVQEKRMKMMKKSLISRGSMLYKAPSMLRWEYTEPYSYLFIIKDNIVSTLFKGKVSRIDAGRNKIFGEIVKIMLGSVTGSCINGSGGFQTRLFTDVNGDVVALMKPLKSEMKQVFRELLITFDSRNKVPMRVEMHEESGDTTIISLQEIKKDVTLHNNLFEIKDEESN